MSILIAFDIFIVACLLAVGFAVLARDSRSGLNRLFFGFVSTISVWLIANYFSNNFEISYSSAVIANHITLFSPGAVLLFLLSFSLILARKHVSMGWIITITLSALIYLLALTPLMFTAIEKQGNVYAINFTALGAVYFLTILFNAVAVLTVLFQARKKARGVDHSRLNALLWGVTAILIINIATNLILPFVGNVFALTNFGPLSTIFVIYALWVSIVKHRLFDLRLVVARSVAYVLVLVVLGFFFIFGAFALVNVFFSDKQTDAELLRWVYTLLAATLAFIAAPLKSFFDDFTDKIFFKDRYDPQALLEELSHSTVGTVDVETLTRDAVSIIPQHLKTEFAYITLWPTGYSDTRYIGNIPTDMTKEEHESIKAYVGHILSRVVIADEIATEHPELNKLMRRHHIAALVRLATTVEYEADGLGILVIGDKKSGSPFMTSDAKVLSIVAGDLVIAIQNALRFEEIEKFSITLQEKVDDATRKLQKSNEKLKAMDETKDEFISMASHQLRTPLTSVKGYVSMVLEGDAGEINDMQRKLLDQAFTSSQRMVFLIADLLNLSRLRTGKFVIEASPTNLADVIQGEVEQLQETAAGRSLTLKYEKPVDFPTLMLDETKIRQVIMNFVDNAIYYTPAGGAIEIKLKQTKDSVEFTVHDNGIGVPKSEQHHLFNKFYRARNAQKARPDGTGLGLFMAKKVIMAQGGAILFKSAEGKGSMFGFTFSKHKVRVPEIKTVQSEETATAAN